MNIDHASEEKRRQTDKARSSIFSIASTLALFFAVAASQLNLEFTIPEKPDLIEDAYIAPPPPPPLQMPQPETDVDFDISLDIDPTPFEVSLNFLQVKVGASKPISNEVSFDVDAVVADYKTDGLSTLRVYERHELDTPPIVTKMHTPNPKGELRYLTIEAIVQYRLTPLGQALNITILHINIPTAENLVKEAILKSKFKPAYKDGEPVNTWIRQPVKITGLKKKTYDPFKL